MDLYKSLISICTRKIMLSRIRLIVNKPFYGMLLMHFRAFLGDCNEKVWIEGGDKLFFNPGYLQEVRDWELDKDIVSVLDEFVENVISGDTDQYEQDDESFDEDDENSEEQDDSSEEVKEKNDEGLDESEEKNEDKSDEGDGRESDNTEQDDSTGRDDVEENKSQNSSADLEKGNYKRNNKDVNKKNTNKIKQNKERFNRDLWLSRIKNIAETVSVQNASIGMGGIPLLAQRLLKQMESGQIDWREVLNNFIQEEITDYSFTPPDRRFDDSDFFLPDYNEKEEKLGNIWFVVDTSGSISDDAIAAAYAEISNAVLQFNGKLEAELSFTESFVTDPIPFSTIEELMAIKPVGGGGNDFSDIFRYMNENMGSNLPAQIIIITDGYDEFPDEGEAMGVPVLWLINNEKVNPPWGKVARMKVSEN